MKLKHLFFINIFFSIFFGIACVFFAGWAIRIYGLAPDIGSLWTTRLAGGSILGLFNPHVVRAQERIAAGPPGDRPGPAHPGRRAASSPRCWPS